MKKSRDDIKKALTNASEILFDCNLKAIVLKVCNDSAGHKGGFPETEEEDVNAVYDGISLILSEIIEQVSEAQSLIQRVESSVDEYFKAVANKVTA